MHISALMKEFGAPMTRDEYLKWNNLGKSNKVSPEEEAEMPHRFAYPVVTHNELPETKEGEGQGAPADFAGPVFPNEGGVHVEDSDAPPAVTPTRMSGGAKPHQTFERSFVKPKTMDVSNPAKAQIEHDPMVPIEQ